MTIVATGWMVGKALAAAESLVSEGIECEVIDPRTLAPLDTARLAESLRKTHHMVITHDAYRTCGVAAEISQRMMECAFDYLDAPVARVTGLDVPIPSGPSHLSVVPDRVRIAEAVRGVLN